MAQRGMWHLVEQRTINTRKKERKKVKLWSENAMSEDLSWSEWKHVQKQVRKINHRDWSTPNRGIKSEEWELRHDFANNEAILGTCSHDLNEEGHRVEFIRRITSKEVKIFLGEGNKIRSLTEEKVRVNELWQRRVMWRSLVGQSPNSQTRLVCFLQY